MVEGCKDKKKWFSSCTETYGTFFAYFVTQNARRAFAAVVVSLVIRCMLYYYMYHVALHLSQLEENKLWVPSLLIRVSRYLWRTPQVLFHSVGVGCFLLWCRSWSQSRKQPPLKRSKPSWWSQQSWLGKVFELRWCFQKRLNEDMANKQTSLIFNSSSANKKNSLYSQGWFKCDNRSAWERFFKSPPPTVIDSELLASIRGWWWFQSVLANRSNAPELGAGTFPE